MSSSTPRASDLPRGAALVLVGASLLAALAGCGERPPELNIVLERAREGQPDEAALANLNFIKVTVRELASTTPEVFPPFAIDRSQSVRLAAEVPPDSPFYVDVWGCPAEETCGALDVVARGCTDVLTIPEGQADLVVVVVMDDYPPPVPVDCPPAAANQPGS